MAFSFLRKSKFTFWQMLEGRALLEWQGFYLLRGLLKKLPQGDGHPVIVFPGFMASDISTKPLRKLLDDLGYSTYGWDLGRNVVFNQDREQLMRNLLRNVHQRAGRRVSLIGWSLGGVFVRELAKFDPELVRSVITLGSPISGEAEHSNARYLFDSLNGKPSEKRKQRMTSLNFPPLVPTTSIYSKSDGIVAWEGSVQHPKHSLELTENIEVPGSHLGLGVNLLAIYAIVDRLAQDDGNWQPFELTGFKKLFYREPKHSISAKTEVAY